MSEKLDEYKKKMAVLARAIYTSELIKFTKASINEFKKSEQMAKSKTPTKKKAVKKPKNSKNLPVKFTRSASTIPSSLYELYRTKSGAWKFRKRARNGEILNHSYNSKALAIKGMKADFRLTKEMAELKWKEVKG